MLCWLWFQEFSPGSNGRTTTMGVYVRDLLLGQVSFFQVCFIIKMLWRNELYSVLPPPPSSLSLGCIKLVFLATKDQSLIMHAVYTFKCTILYI